MQALSRVTVYRDPLTRGNPWRVFIPELRFSICRDTWAEAIELANKWVRLRGVLSMGRSDEVSRLRGVKD